MNNYTSTYSVNIWYIPMYSFFPLYVFAIYLKTYEHSIFYLGGWIENYIYIPIFLKIAIDLWLNIYIYLYSLRIRGEKINPYVQSEWEKRWQQKRGVNKITEERKQRTNGNWPNRSKKGEIRLPVLEAYNTMGWVISFWKHLEMLRNWSQQVHLKLEEELKTERAVENSCEFLPDPT